MSLQHKCQIHLAYFRFLLSTKIKIRLGKRKLICLLLLILLIMWFLFGDVSSSSGCWDELRYFLWHSLSLPYNYFDIPIVVFFIFFCYVSFEIPIIKETFPKYCLESHSIRPLKAVLLIKPDNVRTTNIKRSIKSIDKH